MAMCGGEWGEWGYGLEPGQKASPSLTFVTSPVRTGTYALRSSSGQQAVFGSLLASDSYAQVYVRWASFPGASSVQRVMQLSNTAPTTLCEIRVNTDGTAELWAGNTLAKIGSSSSALSTGVWYRFELMGFNNGAGAGTGSAAFRIDGVEIASSTSLDITNAANELLIGGQLVSGTNNCDCYFDDLVWNNNADGVNDSWPGGQSVVLSRPTGDAINTNWRQGDASTANLWAALDNIPLFYDVEANETATTNVESASNTGTANFAVDCSTYSQKGITAADTINSVCGVIQHGEAINTGTKTGTFEMSSNPVVASASFNFGDNAGAHSTVPATTWGYVHRWSQAPSVSIGNHIQLKVVKTDTTTRVACVNAMGAYVAYTPAPADRAPAYVYSRQSQTQAVKRAGFF